MRWSRIIREWAEAFLPALPTGQAGGEAGFFLVRTCGVDSFWSSPTTTDVLVGMAIFIVAHLTSIGLRQSKKNKEITIEYQL